MADITNNLMQYPLSGRLITLLRIADRMAQNLARQGAQVPPTIGLTAADFDEIDRLVRTWTNDRFSASGVHWNGRYLHRAGSVMAA